MRDATSLDHEQVYLRLVRAQAALHAKLERHVKDPGLLEKAAAFDLTIKRMVEARAKFDAQAATHKVLRDAAEARLEEARQQGGEGAPGWDALLQLRAQVDEQAAELRIIEADNDAMIGKMAEALEQMAQTFGPNRATRRATKRTDRRRLH